MVCFDLDVGGIPWQTCRSGRTARYILGRSQLLCLFCDNALSQYYGVCLVVGIPNAKVCPCDSIFSLLYAPSPRMWIFTYMWSRVLEPCMRAKRGKGRIYYFFLSLFVSEIFNRAGASSCILHRLDCGVEVSCAVAGLSLTHPSKRRCVGALSMKLVV